MTVIYWTDIPDLCVPFVSITLRGVLVFEASDALVLLGSRKILFARKIILIQFPGPKKSNSNHVNNSKTARFCTFEGKMEE